MEMHRQGDLGTRIQMVFGCCHSHSSATEETEAWGAWPVQPVMVSTSLDRSAHVSAHRPAPASPWAPSGLFPEWPLLPGA